MRKRVTFVDHLKNDNLFGVGRGRVLMRSAEETKRRTDGFECLRSETVRDTYRGTHLNVPAVGQHMKTTTTPRSLMAAPFLQHPALTAGQRRYLCSIASIYSTEHLRRQMQQHYVNVLQACLHSGPNDTCRRKYGAHQRRENSTFTTHAEKDATRANQPQQQRRNCNRANSDITLPKIVNR